MARRGNTVPLNPIALLCMCALMGFVCFALVRMGGCEPRTVTDPAQDEMFRSAEVALAQERMRAPEELAYHGCTLPDSGWEWHSSPDEPYTFVFFPEGWKSAREGRTDEEWARTPQPQSPEGCLVCFGADAGLVQVQVYPDHPEFRATVEWLRQILRPNIAPVPAFATDAIGIGLGEEGD